MGSSNMRSFMGMPEIDVKAICDVDTSRMGTDFNDVDKKYGRKPDVYTDYRKMLEDKDIDIVIIGSPDHWHAHNLIHACQAGKDIYCEKPISHNIVEAKAMVAAQQTYGRVVQVGTWQRSTQEFADAIAYVRADEIGKIVHCRCWVTDYKTIGNAKVTAPPSSLDYDMWIGPAQMVPYKENQVHYNWRVMQNTGGGQTTDWGVHMIDIALLGMSKDQNLPMPTQVSALGGKWAFPTDDRDAADTVESIMLFEDPDFVLTWSVQRDRPGKPGHGTEFIGANGMTVRVWRGGWVVLDPDGKEIPKKEGEKLPTNHWRDFINCVKTRQKPRADLASVGQTTIICHLANAAMYQGKEVRWNNALMDIEGRDGKNTIAYRRSYRKGFELPKI